MMMWQPIETAPKDRFLLLCGPSGYTTTPLVFTTGRMCSDYHASRWIDHANDDLSDWGFEPTHWMPLPEAPGSQAQPAPRVPEGVFFIDTGSLKDVVSAEIAHSYPPPSGWLRAIDEALVVTHLGVANASDTYEQAKSKLQNLIGWHVDVATDPAVNGGWKLVPVKPTEEMLAAAMNAPIPAAYLDSISARARLQAKTSYSAMLAAAPEAKS